MHKLFLILLGSLLSGLAIAEPLVIYSGRSDRFVQPVIDAWSAQSGQKVILHSGKSTQLLGRLRLEGPRTRADLFLSNDAGTLQVGADQGLFAQLPPDLVEPVPGNYRDAQRRWVGLSARGRVLVVNRERGPDWVAGVADLADPRLAGQLAITSSANESFIAGATVYRNQQGDAWLRQWLRGLQRNAAGEAFAKHSAVVAAVARGDKTVGLVNHYYLFRHLDQHPQAPLTLVLPDQGADDMGMAWNVAGIAQSRHSRQPEQAQALIAYLLSPAGQRQFAEANREYPVRLGVPVAAGLPAPAGLRIAPVPMSALGHERGLTLDAIEAVGLP